MEIQISELKELRSPSKGKILLRVTERCFKEMTCPNAALSSVFNGIRSAGGCWNWAELSTPVGVSQYEYDPSASGPN